MRKRVGLDHGKGTNETKSSSGREVNQDRWRPSWRWSLLLPLAVVGWIGVWMVSDQTQTLTIEVTSGSSGQPVGDAPVQIGNDMYRADASGEIHLPVTEEDRSWTARATGHREVNGVIPAGSSEDIKVQLPSIVIPVVVRDAVTSQPVADVRLIIEGIDDLRYTDDRGHALIRDLPISDQVEFSHPDYSDQTMHANTTEALVVTLTMSPVSGTVVGEDGQPAIGLEIITDMETVRTDERGQFTLNNPGRGLEVTLVREDGVQVVTVTSRDLGFIHPDGATPIAFPQATP